MDRRVTVISHHALGDQDRVFVVITVPWHKAYQHVLAQRQFTHVSRRAIRHHVTAGNDVANFNQRTLVDVGVLVRTGVFGQVVDVHTDFACQCFRIMHADHDTA